MNLTLDRPRKLSVEPDGKKGPLLLFANPLEINTPEPGDTGVIYFGPGVHKPEKIVLESNQTLYLAGGSVVKAEVLAQGANIQIRGRGILDGSDWEWRKGPVGNLIAIRNSSDVEVNGITLGGSVLWCDRARIFLLGHESRAAFMRNVTSCGADRRLTNFLPCSKKQVHFHELRF